MSKILTGAAGLLFIVLSATLAGCNLFGPPPAAGKGTVNDAPVVIRSLPADFSDRKAVAYAGVRTATQTDEPSLADVEEDLALLNDQNFRLLRLFSSGGTFARRVLETIRDADENGYDMKVQLGIWIEGPKATKDTQNQAEITAGVALAQEFPTIVAAVSVGNEKMVDWNIWAPAPAADVIEYIKQVRGQVTQPVTTDDNWAVFANDAGKYPKTKQLLANIDYAAIHTYPLSDSPHGLWNWKQLNQTDLTLRAGDMMDEALVKAKADYQAVRDNLDDEGYSGLPIVIGETGWKSSPSKGESFQAHPVNQKMYYDRLSAWTDGPAAIMYFEAFDEPWKGSDDKWGLWDVDRNAKYVISGTGYSSSDALYYVPPVPNGTITKNTYLAYADTLAANATTAVPTQDTMWLPWESSASGAEVEVSGSDTAAEGSKYLRISPNPTNGFWGFFLRAGELTDTDDLTNFLAEGHLKFSIRTTYAGKLEVGFFTLGTDDVPGNSDVYMSISDGQYGFENDGAWHEVSIPIATLADHSAPAWEQPTTAEMNLQLVSSPFTIADRYGVTGNTLTAQQKVLKVDVDNIRWTRD